jgi:hypothetical protein
MRLGIALSRVAYVVNYQDEELLDMALAPLRPAFCPTRERGAQNIVYTSSGATLIEPTDFVVEVLETTPPTTMRRPETLALIAPHHRRRLCRRVVPHYSSGDDEPLRLGLMDGTNRF